MAIYLDAVTDIESRIQEEFQGLNVRITPALAKFVQRYYAGPNGVDNRLAVTTLDTTRGYLCCLMLNSRVQKASIAETEAGVGFVLGSRRGVVPTRQVGLGVVVLASRRSDRVPGARFGRRGRLECKPAGCGSDRSSGARRRFVRRNVGPSLPLS